jgi:hypothetical protein
MLRPDISQGAISNMPARHAIRRGRRADRRHRARQLGDRQR